MWAELGRELDNTHSGVRIKKGQESRDKKDVGPNNLPGNMLKEALVLPW